MSLRDAARLKESTASISAFPVARLVSTADVLRFLRHGSPVGGYPAGLQAVQSDLTRLTGPNDIRVVLNNGSLLGISVMNSPLRELPVAQKRAKALEIARLAYKSYRSRTDLRGESVVFGVHRDYLGIFRYENSTDIYRFEISELSTDHR